MVNIYENVAKNRRNSSLILLLFVVFITGSAYVMARGLGYGLDIVILFFILSCLGSLLGYYTSDSIVLTLSGAKPAEKRKDTVFFSVTENLSMAAHMPMPKLYVIQDTAMNAFATGRDPSHASICATTGLLTALNRTELEGVIAHELSHVRNYDTRLMAVVAVMVGMLALLADLFLRISYFGGRKKSDDRGSGQLQMILFLVGIVLALLSPIIAQLIQLAVSRKREFLADASGVALTKYPEGLAHALEKLSKDTEPLEAANKATAHLYIVNPLTNRKDAVSWFSGLFNTHPPVAERIKMLRAME